MHLSHLFEDVGAWWLRLLLRTSEGRRRSGRARPDPAAVTLPQPAREVETAEQVEDGRSEFGVVGHSALQQPAPDYRRRVDNYGNVRRKGATLPTVPTSTRSTTPSSGSSRPEVDRQGAESAAGVHFVAFMPTAAIFHRMRLRDGWSPLSAGN